MKFMCTGLMIVGLVSWAPVSLAQIATAPTQSNPLAPAPTDPQGVLASYLSTWTRLQWRQQELSPANTNAVARYFLLCMYVPGTSDCASTPLRWMQAATTIHREPVKRPAVVAAPVATAYDYFFRVTDPPTNVQLEWRVAACGSELESSCTFADAPTPVWFTTRDLRALDIEIDESDMRWLRVGGRVSNQGYSDSGPFETHLLVFQALVDRYGHCVYQVDAEGVEPWHSVITEKGEIIEIRDLPRDENGRPIADGLRVVAIVPAPSLPVVWHNTIDSELLEDEEATVVTVEEDLSGYQLPAAFALQLLVDVNDRLTEFNENNNREVGCYVVRGE